METIVKTQLLFSVRRIVVSVLIAATCAIATGCPHGKGYFAPTPARATHVAPSVADQVHQAIRE